MQNNKDKHKFPMQSFDKGFVIASLRADCIKKSTERSVEVAKMIFENKENQKDVYRNMGIME